MKSQKPQSPRCSQYFSLLAPLSRHVVADERPLSRVFRGFLAHRAPVGGKNSAPSPAREESACLYAAPLPLALTHVGQPLRTRQCRMGFAAKIQGVRAWTRHIEQFDVLYPTPKRTRCRARRGRTEICRKVTRAAAQAKTPHRIKHPSSFPPYHVYSKDGDVHRTAGFT